MCSISLLDGHHGYPHDDINLGKLDGHHGDPHDDINLENFPKRSKFG